MKIEAIGFEISNQCNLKCEICARSVVQQKEVQYILPDDFANIRLNEVDELKRINMIGFRGDSLTNPYLLEILDITKDWDKFLTLGTNGNFYDEKWWYDLPKHLPKGHKVIFALDGVDNKTLAIYRRGAIYDRVIKNAQAFIAGGGRAVWQFIIFKFNEHLVEDVKNLAKEMGFIDTILLASTIYDDKKYQRPTSGLMSDFEYSDANRKKGNMCRLQFGKIAISSMGEYLPCCIAYFPDDVKEVMRDEPIKYIKDYSLQEVLDDGYYDRIFKRILKGDIEFCNKCAFLCGMRNI